MSEIILDESKLNILQSTLQSALDIISVFKKEIEVEKPKPLFRSEDEVDIYEGDKYWLVSETNFLIAEFTANKNREPYYADLVFSTKEKAEEYILLNKPILSVNEVMDFFRQEYEKRMIYNPSHGEIKQWMKDLAKKKLNQ